MTTRLFPCGHMQRRGNAAAARRASDARCLASASSSRERGVWPTSRRRWHAIPVFEGTAQADALTVVSGCGALTRSKTVTHAPIAPLRHQFLTINLGTTLILKASGFIAAHRATILDVEPGLLKLRVGRSWLERWFVPATERDALAVSLTFEDMSPDAARAAGHAAPAGNCCAVQVAIHPSSSGWTEETFHEASRRLLWSLRSHFIAS